MKIIRKFIFTFLFLTLSICLCCGCFNNDKINKKQVADSANKVSYRKKNFDSLMSVDKNVQLEDAEELLNDKSFEAIFEHSPLYLNDAITFLSKGHFTDAQAIVCICAMQNLKLNDYLKFCRYYLSLFRENKISELIMEDAISSDFLKKRIIINNYDNPNVVALLNGLENDKKINNKDFKKSIPDILSGKSKKELDAFDAGNK